MQFVDEPVLPGIGGLSDAGLTEADVDAALDKIGKVVLRNKELVYATCAPNEDPLEFEYRCVDAYLQIFKIYSVFSQYQQDKGNLAALHALFRVHMAGQHKLGEMWKVGDLLSRKQTTEAAISQWVTGMWQTFLIGNLRTGRGRRFELRRTLAEILTRTDATIPATELRLPFLFMAIKIPSGLISLNEQGRGDVDCRYIVVSKQRIRPGDLPEAYEKPIDTLNVLVLSAGTNDPAGGLVLLETLPLREGYTVHEEIAALEERRENIYTRPGLVNIDTSEETKSNKRGVMGTVLNLVANTCLYCTNRGADVVPHNMQAINKKKAQLARYPSGKKRRKLNQKLEEEKRRSIYIIGQGYEPKDGELLQNVKEAGKLSQRHMVRGHWKMQAYGEGRTKRRFIFVEPYWRGPELAEMVARDYVVE